MKKLILILAVIAVSCNTKEEKKETNQLEYPQDILNVFDAHGGIDKWKSSRTLIFEKGDEVHKTDLWSRKTVVQSEEYSYGFDGENIWVSDTTKFKRDPKFYYNLFFYFYSMPFVLADDGITYEKIDDLKHGEINYSGYKISFQKDKGSSPDDNYYLYFNKENNQMEWLGYTVTYFSKKPTSKMNMIRYHDWQTVNGLKLPKSITWYKKDSLGNPTEPSRPPVDFKNVLIGNEVLDNAEFQKPKN